MEHKYVILRGSGQVYQLGRVSDPENYQRIPIDDHSAEELEEDGWIDYASEYAFIEEDLELSLTNDIYEGEEIDITKKKGKYILTNNYFSDIIGYKAPFYCNLTIQCYIEEVFKIPLNGEEFDPKKLQLIKSDYELSFFPYAIVTSHIMYDGKIYTPIDSEGYPVKNFRPFIYDEKQPYASSNRAISLSKDMIVEQEYEE